MEATPKADLVCEGGGIRGIGLTGAVHTLAAAGYQFPRVAGSSAGAVVASMIAALQVAGEPFSYNNVDFVGWVTSRIMATP